MKKYLITLTFVLFAIAMYCSCAAYNRIPGDNEITKSVEGERVICRCAKSSGDPSNDKCKASNNGNPCAQSEPGGSINCSKFDSNC